MNTIFSAQKEYDKAIIGLPINELMEQDTVGNAQEHYESLLTQALTIAHNTPDVRKEKIEAIRAQIANGTYEIDSKHIAESLIRENPALFEE